MWRDRAPSYRRERVDAVTIAAASNAIPADTPTAAPMIMPIPGIPKKAPNPAPAARPARTHAGMPATPQRGKTRRGIASAPAGGRARAPPRPQDRQNLAGFRKPPLPVPGKYQLVAQRDVEHAAPAPDELNPKALLATQFRLQTGGARKIVSVAAVLDD